MPLYSPTTPALLSVVTKTSGYTATISDDIINLDATGGAFTLTLYDPASNSGKQLVLTKTDTSTNAITLGSFNINGASRKLCTEQESVTIYSDGTAWRVRAHTYKTDSTSWTATGSWNSNVTYSGFYYRVGGRLKGFQKIVCGAVPGPAATNLSITLPFTMDTAQINDTSAGLQKVGDVQILDAGVQFYPSIASYNSSTTILINTSNSAGTFTSSVGTANSTSGTPISFGASDEVLVQFDVPIVDWW
jgi:hypothetical protein